MSKCNLYHLVAVYPFETYHYVTVILIKCTTLNVTYLYETDYYVTAQIIGTNSLFRGELGEAGVRASRPGHEVTAGC